MTDKLIQNEVNMVTTPEYSIFIDETSKTTFNEKLKRERPSNLTTNKVIQRGAGLKTNPQYLIFKNETPYTISRKDYIKRQKQKIMHELQGSTSHPVESKSMRKLRRSASCLVESKSRSRHKKPLRSNSLPNKVCEEFIEKQVESWSHILLGENFDNVTVSTTTEPVDRTFNQEFDTDFKNNSSLYTNASTQDACHFVEEGLASQSFQKNFSNGECNINLFTLGAEILRH
ncbi:7436_t:CDS:2 [Cetraspora pellucida]|uniref:7436_t:CDS:1 n=1 Tax=Cetraspora pellucida TaxID=1433469 RepID=A0ACA9LGS2_9GLOM|nr:7436_t:CDS:2 [Cetraspora pellucida]